MGIEEFIDRLIYCNPYTNPLGCYKHFLGDYTPSELDSPFVKFYENNKKNCNDNDDFKKLFPMLDLTCKTAEKCVEKPSTVLKASLGPIFGGLINTKQTTLDEDVKTVEKIPSNLTVEERKEYIREHGGGLRYPEKK